MKSENTKLVKVDEGKVLKDSVDTSRRSFAKGGVVTPILMTLASKPVFAVQCMSEQMSGTHSNGTESCVTGDSPGGWANPGGTIGGVSTIQAWTSILGADSYGVYTSTNHYGNNTSCGIGHTEKAACYSGGITFNELFNGQAAICGVSELGAQNSATVRDILLPAGTAAAHLAAAMLNALYFPNYVVKRCDVIALWNGSKLPPNNLSINEFLDSTW